jgi:hypothetical protein
MQADASSIGFSISAYGTFRTCHGFQVESAFGSKGQLLAQGRRSWACPLWRQNGHATLVGSGLSLMQLCRDHKHGYPSKSGRGGETTQNADVTPPRCSNDERPYET